MRKWKVDFFNRRFCVFMSGYQEQKSVVVSIY